MGEDYLDFDLRIWSAPGGYGVSASSLGYGGSGAESFQTPQFGDGLARSGLLYRELGSPEEQVLENLQDLGRRLFETVFVGDIRRFWDTCRAAALARPIRLRLILQCPEAWDWPWEFLFDPTDDFLVLLSDISVVRCPEVPKRIPPLRVDRPISILVVTANPVGTQKLGAEQEWRELKVSLKALEDSGLIDVRLLENASRISLRKELKKGCHILHFIGHGSFDRRRQRGYLLLERGDGRQDRITGKDLALLLQVHSPAPALVVLNACQTGRANQEDPFAGVAQSLIRRGLPAVVAMRFPVADEASIAFSKSFYETLAEGETLDRAVFQGRYSLTEYSEGSWGNPVLYMRTSDGKIFDVVTRDQTTNELVQSQIKSEAPPAQPQKGRYRAALAAGVGTLAIGLGIWAVSNRFTPVSDSGCPSPSDLKMSFAKILPSKFTMGGSRGEEKPAHAVQITRSYCIGKFEVTQFQWRRLMPNNKSRHRGDDLPVEGVSWYDAQAFIDRLNQIDPGKHYHFPTEAEWELAALEGGGSPDPAEMSRYGNCKGRQNEKTVPVGSYKPNSLGIYDLYGNVSEWVSDWYDSYPASPQIDPVGPPTGDAKVRRGGFFGNSPNNCSAVYRSSSKPGYHFEGTGFRIASDALK